MGNLVARKTIDIQLLIDTTKNDIKQDYDLTTMDGVKKANEELMLCFAKFSDEDLNYVRSQLFTQESSF